MEEIKDSTTHVHSPTHRPPCPLYRSPGPTRTRRRRLRRSRTRCWSSCSNYRGRQVCVPAASSGGGGSWAGGGLHLECWGVAVGSLGGCRGQVDAGGSQVDAGDSRTGLPAPAFSRRLLSAACWYLCLPACMYLTLNPNLNPNLNLNPNPNPNPPPCRVCHVGAAARRAAARVPGGGRGPGAACGVVSRFGRSSFKQACHRALNGSVHLQRGVNVDAAVSCGKGR